MSTAQTNRRHKPYICFGKIQPEMKFVAGKTKGLAMHPIDAARKTIAEEPANLEVAKKRFSELVRHKR